MAKLFIIFLALLFSSVSSASETVYRRPVPDTISIKDPTRASHIFEALVVYQLHATLFRLDSQNIAVPYLAKDFSVSDAGKVYKIILDDRYKLPSGAQINSHIVKKSLEYAIKADFIGSEDFSIIEGLTEFRQGKSNQIRGISVLDNVTLEIHLLKPLPRFIYLLTNLRTAILGIDRDPRMGFGPYSVKAFDNRHLKLIAKADHPLIMPRSPDHVEILTKSKEEAIVGFSEGIYHDLTFYSLQDNEIEPLKPRGTIVVSHFPRTYLLALNSKTIPDRKLRRSILSLISKKELIESCYPGATMANSIVPPGFFGYDERMNSPEKIEAPKVEKLNIAILKTIGMKGGDQCVLDFFNHSFSSIKGRSINVISVEVALEKWKNKQLDGMFLFLEADTEHGLATAFLPNENAFFGDHKTDLSLDIAALNEITNPIERDTATRLLFSKIRNLETVLPVLHPKQKLIYSQSLLLPRIGVRSVVSIPISNYTFKDSVKR